MLINVYYKITYAIIGPSQLEWIHEQHRQDIQTYGNANNDWGCGSPEPRPAPAQKKPGHKPDRCAPGAC